MAQLFSRAILRWFSQHGRHDLPWQINPTPYRVWISEIMLQQTQVKTVIPYFQKFITRFPGVAELAIAQQDDVLSYWSGLGYYARARNLHKAAKKIIHEFSGEFPNTQIALESLSGIGRSTAGAILSLSTINKIAAIMDGNVKRVFCRYFQVDGYPGNKKIHDQLWDLAHKYLPSTQSGDYNQALMDLGATICTRSKPICDECPLQKNCLAFKNHVIDDYPNKKPKTIRPTKTTCMQIVLYKNEVLLFKREQSGIWGGLWSFPEFDLNIKSQQQFELEKITHDFSHYRLIITSVILQVKTKPKNIKEEHMWFDLNSKVRIGIPKPVISILEGIESVNLVKNTLG